MAFRLAPAARDDLDAIWDYVAREARDAGPADRLIDAITERLWLLAQHPQIGRAAMIRRPACEALRLAIS